jgi:gliding motility-associated-like protein
VYFTLPAVAQKQANIWYFGNRVGLDFNAIPPKPIYNSVLNAVEGSAVIADNNGKLLFYSNGISIANRKHEIIKNGAGLLGDLSSTDNVLIIPSPGNDSIFYVFTVGSAFQQNKGFRYTIINGNADGGFGEVTTKNSILQPDAFEKLAAVKHCNNKDVWVVIHKWNSDEYYAYLVTAAGVNNNPIVSHSGLTITGNENNAIGTLKFSVDGKKLAAMQSYANNIIELMDFDNATGLLFNAIRFNPDPPSTIQTFTGAYGAEFSPSGNMLYVSDNVSFDEPAALYQFDISSNNAATILATKQIIARLSTGVAGALQTAPDNKIYMAILGETYLSVIENPDTYGAGCNFVKDKIFLGQNSNSPVQLGLPKFVPSYFNLLSNPYDFTRTGNCADKNVPFIINRLNGIDSVKWDFGDGQLSNQISPVHHYNNSGWYNINLIVYKLDCSGLNDTINKKIWVAENIPLLGKDVATCNFENLELNVTTTNVNYLWSTGSTDNKTTINLPGKYWVEIEQQGCTIADTITLTKRAKPIVEIGNDTTVCISEGVILQTTNTTATAYLWNTGETTPSITIFKPGNYSVQVTENTCVNSDTVKVIWGDCPFYIPNAFTPNGDGINDKFGIINGSTVPDFSMKIYNRYGRIVFAANNLNNKWDGTFKGKAMPSGVYTWQIIYKNSQDYTKWLKGIVLLIH